MDPPFLKERSETAAPERSRTSIVLVVDDERDIVDSLALVLKQDLEGVTVRTANNGASALEILRSEPVSVIISDYKMPGMNGIEFLARARLLAPASYRIIMTAYPDRELAARAAREAGVGLFIAKPFDLSYLVSLVRSIVRGSAGS